VAGPIQRGESFLPQMHRPAPARFGNVMLGIQRILLGYFKKIVVADNLLLLVNFTYGHLHNAEIPLFPAFYAFPLQVYADFSGLTDIAIGSAWLLGIASPENFNAPFAASTPSEYWRRWHITLTSWVTDYVFTPLRLATRAWGHAGLVFSLVVNMVLIGLWHSFRWTFVLFGLLQAGYLSVDALTSRARKRYYRAHPGANRLTDWIGPVVTFHLMAIGMVFFHSEQVAPVFYFLAHLGRGIAAPTGLFHELGDASANSVLTGFCAYIPLEIFDYFRRWDQQGELVAALPRWGRWSVYSCTAITALLAIMLLLSGGHNRNPFVYAIF
jgi:hypothetical protein